MFASKAKLHITLYPQYALSVPFQAFATDLVIILVKTTCGIGFGKLGELVDNLAIVPLALVIPHRPAEPYNLAGAYHRDHVFFDEILYTNSLVGRP